MASNNNQSINPRPVSIIVVFRSIGMHLKILILKSLRNKNTNVLTVQIIRNL
jgi:hypothetical protein